MTPQYAFFFDARFCSGCKACQAACKDKNNLPTGVLWRRVVEVSGGTWQQNGEAWNNSVFAYNVSIACNHCIYPKCAGVCPTKAYSIREDGIVILDTGKCMGCGYCAWACPYGAPQYNPEAGFMTKCNFCFDQLEQGLPPVCVAACPMRVLDYGEMTSERGVPLWDTPSDAHPYPLPVSSHTQPRLAIKPHAAMQTPAAKHIANQEEIQPRISSGREHMPLIAFTLLTQMAVGGFWAAAWMFPPLWLLAQRDLGFLTLLPLLVVGLCLGVGMLASLAHLGTKRNALRALANLRKSWLSREILFTGLFGASWLFTTLERAIWHRNAFESMAFTAILGIGLIYSMAQVYRLPAAPAWNTWRTNAGFLVSALLLGGSIMATLLSYESEMISVQLLSAQQVVIGTGIVTLLLAQVALLSDQATKSPFQDIRVVVILFAIALAAVGVLRLELDVTWISGLLFLAVAGQEALGRGLFYRSRT